MKKTNRPMVLLALLSILFVSGCSKKDEPTPVIRPVRTTRITEIVALAGRVFPGRAEAVLAVDIAFEVSGQLIERPMQVGDVVKTGQMLAKLEPSDFINDVEAATARQTQATAYFQRIEKAAKSGAVSQQDLTDAQAQLDIAKADLKIKQNALADSQITAPFEGTISAIYVENHENVRAKQNVLRLMDISTLELRVDIPEKLIVLIDSVKDIEVTFDAFPNHPVPATIKEIGREASAATRTFPVTLAINQPGEFTILPGMTGQATGKGRASTVEVGVTQIPGEAAFEEAGKTFVWIVDESSMTVTRAEIVPKEANRLGMLVQGLNVGQQIVTAGVHNLSEGQPVRLLEEK
jgi:RND family efflux transporter MFP subunit